MIDLKEAAEIAKNFIVDFNGEQGDLQLVAVSLSTDRTRWEVIYSFNIKLQELNQLQRALGITQRKVHKKVTIDNETKQVIGYAETAYEQSEAA